MNIRTQYRGAFAGLTNILLAASLFAVACGGPLTLTVPGTERAVGADATIVVEVIEGGNRMVNVRVQHLAPADRISGDAQVFMVWFVNDQGQANKASALAYEPDARVGTAMATTPMRKFKVLVTAESNAQVAEPSDVVVLSKDVSS